MSENTSASDSKQRPWLHWLLTILLSVAVSLSTVVVYDRFFALKIVSADITSFVNNQKKRYLRGDIDDKQIDKEYDKVKNIIKNTPKNEVVILGEVVVANAHRTIDLEK